MSGKKVDWAKYHNRHSSKSIWVIKLSFGQNDCPMGESFWPEDSLITHILFELCLFRNLAKCTLFLLTLYYKKQTWSIIPHNKIIVETHLPCSWWEKAIWVWILWICKSLKTKAWERILEKFMKLVYSRTYFVTVCS